MKMKVHFAYPLLVTIAREFGFRLGTGMNAITPLEDEERGFNGPDGAQIVLNRKNGRWEFSDIDGTFVRRGVHVERVQKLLTKRYDSPEKWKRVFRGEPCVGCGKPATSVNEDSLCKMCFENK